MRNGPKGIRVASEIASQVNVEVFEISDDRLSQSVDANHPGREAP